MPLLLAGVLTAAVQPSIQAEVPAGTLIGVATIEGLVPAAEAAGMLRAITDDGPVTEPFAIFHTDVSGRFGVEIPVTDELVELAQANSNVLRFVIDINTAIIADAETRFYSLVEEAVARLSSETNIVTGNVTHIFHAPNPTSYDLRFVHVGISKLLPSPVGQVPEYDPQPPTPTDNMESRPNVGAAILDLANNTSNVGTVGPLEVADEAMALAYAEEMGRLAAAAIVARDQLGLEPYADMAAETEHELNQLVGHYLLNGIEGLVQQADLPGEEGTLLRASYSSFGGSALADGPYDEQLDAMNEKEKTVCKTNPYDCHRARNTATLSVESATEWYPRFRGHNDVRDAFRHCIWNAFMVKRANAEFARRMGNAHEDGDNDQPQREKDMDLHNNWWGRKAGRELGDVKDQKLEEKCKYYAFPPRDLTWFVGRTDDGAKFK